MLVRIKLIKTGFSTHTLYIHIISISIHLWSKQKRICGNDIEMRDASLCNTYLYAVAEFTSPPSLPVTLLSLAFRQYAKFFYDFGERPFLKKRIIFWEIWEKFGFFWLNENILLPSILPLSDYLLKKISGAYQQRWDRKFQIWIFKNFVW